MLRRFRRAHAHEDSKNLQLNSFIELIGRSCCFVLFETSKGAVPASAFFNQNSIQLVGGKGAGKLKAEKSLASDRVKKEFSFIVDADDKNCLAQLTVVLKSNHGVRQWP